MPPETSTMKSAAVHHPSINNNWPQNAYFKLYPNPADGYITLEYNLDFGVLKPVVEVVSIDGVHVSTFRLINRSGIKIIDLRSISTGVYFVRFQSNGKILQTLKFIKY